MDRQGWEEAVRQVVSRILGSDYESFWPKEYGRYHLPMVKTRSTTYSGFNMGAGENALFEIFPTIFACPEEVLLVIDEIELGLHEEAQTKFIQELKKVCNRFLNTRCALGSISFQLGLPLS